MKRADIVRRAAGRLYSAETSVFTALRDVSLLTAGLIDDAREMGVSPIVGHGTLDELAATTSALHQSRAGIVAVHASLAEVKGQVGAARVELNGGGEKGPPKPFTAPWDPMEGAEAERLRVVA